MRFLKVLFWLLIGGFFTAFVIYNGDERVHIQLSGAMIADVSLPLLLVIVFLAGFLPMLVAYQTLRWRMRQRFAGLERALADLRSIAPAPANRWEIPAAESPQMPPPADEAKP